MGNKAFRLPLALELLLGIVVLLELIAPFVSITYGVDGGYHLRWIEEFTNLVSRGVYIPRWIPGAYSGFGAPSFYYYPPVTYYIAYAIRVLSGIADAKVLFNLTGLLATIASFFAVRPLLDALGAERYQKNIAALLYAFAPLRIAELYSRSNLSVHVSYVFLPLVWLGVLQMFLSTRSYRGLTTIVLSASVLALTNVPLFLVTVVCLGMGAIVCHKQLSSATLRKGLVATLLVAGLTAFHYFTVLSFLTDSRLGGLMVVQPDYLIIDLLHGTNLLAAYHISLLFAAILGIGTIVFKESNASYNGIQQAVLRIGFWIAALVLFLAIPWISVPFWRYFPPLPLIQDSWRFYSYGLLLVVVIFALANTNAMRKAFVTVVWAWSLGALIPIVFVVFHLHIFPHFERSSDVATEYLTNFGVSRDSLVETMKQHKNDASALAEFSPNEYARVIRASPNFERFGFHLNSARTVTFHRFYWPAWHLYANGQEVKSWPDSIGRAVAFLPSGTYEATWQLEQSLLEQTGLLLSALTAAGLFANGAWKFSRKRKIKQLIH